jgi:hypothetical protein
MAMEGTTARIEAQLAQWRVQARRASGDGETDALEHRLREQIATLTTAGLDADEAFLIALRRLGAVDANTLAFARAQLERDFRPPDSMPASAGPWLGREGWGALGFALAAAILIKLPELLGLRSGPEDEFYARNLGLFALPMVAAYFLWRQRASMARVATLAVVVVAAAVVVNLAPFARGGDFLPLTALHLPVALWLVVGLAHAGGRWNEVAARMDFVRFSGGLFILYVLIALGGMVFTALMVALFQAIGHDPLPFFEQWLLPCAAMGAVVIAAWVVDVRQGVLGLVAPLLTRLFTPLFVALLLVFLVALLTSGQSLEFRRDLIIALDVLLVVVLGLVLYALSARAPQQPAGAFDLLQAVLVLAALLVDASALWTIAARISEFGFTPNRVAALGMNLLLLVNLAVSAWLYLRFLRGRGEIAALERWQTAYLPVHAGWATVVVVVFPLLFARG